MQKNQNIINFYQPRNINIENFSKSIEQIFLKKTFTNHGPFEVELTKQIAEKHKVKYCVLVANATIGLQVLLEALEINGEIITTPFTFIASAHAISWQKLKPVFVDIESDFYTLNPALISNKISKKTSCILGVHIFGNPCRLNDLNLISENYNLPVIFDAAHCFGSSYNSVSFGNFGTAEVISFHGTKIFHTFEGGAILTNNEKLFEKLKQIINFGFSGLDTISRLGTNAKLNEVSSAFGLSFLPYFNETKDKLASIHRFYNFNLKKFNGINPLKFEIGLDRNYQYFPVLIDQSITGITRDEIWAFLWSIGIQTRRYFYPLITKIDLYKKQLNINDEFPVAERVSKQILCLPCYFDLTELQLNTIIEGLYLAVSEVDRIKLWFERFISTKDCPTNLIPVWKALQVDN